MKRLFTMVTIPEESMHKFRFANLSFCLNEIHNPQNIQSVKKLL